MAQSALVSGACDSGRPLPLRSIAFRRGYAIEGRAGARWWRRAIQ